MEKNHKILENVKKCKNVKKYKQYFPKTTYRFKGILCMEFDELILK